MDELTEKFLLWEDGGEVVGFASFDADEREMSVFVVSGLSDTPSAVGFEEAAIAWASRGDGPLRWTEFEDEAGAVARWVARGYVPLPGGIVNLTRSLADISGDEPPDDRVQPVGDEDVADRASITHAAFGSDRELTEYAAAYARFRASPAYPHGWDLLLRDEDGAPAACCIAWIDPVSRAGTFEPVATHPDLHRRGFGTALLREGLRRFAAAGMAYAIVGAVFDNPRAEALYRSVGFLPDRLLRTYERPPA